MTKIASIKVNHPSNTMLSSYDYEIICSWWILWFYIAEHASDFFFDIRLHLTYIKVIEFI